MKTQQDDEARGDDESPVRLLGKGGWQEAHPQLLPSIASARYLVRMHKAELIASGALALIAGQWVVIPKKFERALLAIGRLNARGKFLADEAREVASRKRSVAALEKMLHEERASLRAAEAAAGAVSRETQVA